MSESIQIRDLLGSHPLHESGDGMRQLIEVGRNTALLKMRGPLIYATDSTAAWLWSSMESGTFWHELTMDKGHKVAFLPKRLPSVVKMLALKGKLVLIE